MVRILQKNFLSLFLLFFISLFRPLAVFAEDEFAISFDVRYEVAETGKTQVTQDVTLTNKFSTIYATSYQLSLSGSTPQSVKVYNASASLPFEVNAENNQTQIKINFPEAVVGKDKSRQFTVSYTLSDAATKNGAVWEVVVPKVAEAASFTSYNLSLIVPASFGKPAYVSPQPLSTNSIENSLVLNFQGWQLEKAGAVAAFGEFQVFDFNLAYHLKNPYQTPAQTEIALPPDTAYQRVFYRDISPAPENIRLDLDGNWLARYQLEPQQELNVKTQGWVQIFARPQNFYPRTEPEDLAAQLASSEFWQTTLPEIKNLAAKLKTPEAIYNFVVSNLTYDYSRVRQGVERLGAAGALENPQNAICLEFTDLFITLARASGIPAREVNGFAYTDNPRIQPLSLVADVLHAWPEYWSEALGVWVPVDPTWGATSGIDYFSKLDLNHFTFAIHGQSPTEPAPAGSYKLGTSPQKDVNVGFGQLPAERSPRLEVDFLNFGAPLGFLQKTSSLGVKNLGPVASYNLQVQLQGRGINLAENLAQVPFLPPFATQVLPVTWSLSQLVGWRSPATLEAIVAANKFSYNIPPESLLASQILVLALVLLALTGVILGTRHYAAIAKKIAELARRLPIPGR